MLKFIPEETNIDFVRKRYSAFAVTLLLFVLAVWSLGFHGLNKGIDFSGGILIDASHGEAVDVHGLREKLSSLGLGEVALQNFGDDKTVLIRVQQQEGGDARNAEAIATIKGALGEGWNYNRVESVGPTVGNELLRTSFYATLLAVVGIGLYVAFRFEWQFGVAAVVTNFHDVFVSLGLIAVLGMEFNLTMVAALMLLAGKSINDTVIIFDRIRETLRRYKQMPMTEVINLSVNRTLSRTIQTSVTTLLALIPMLFWGGDVLVPFAIVIVWGIAVATFSSIYVASSLLLYLPPLRLTKDEAQAAAQTA